MPPATAADHHTNGITNGLSALSLRPSLSPDNHRASLTLRFCVTRATQYGQTVHLSASAPALGAFQPESALPLTFEHPGVWAADLVHPVADPVLRYKYFLRDDSCVVWEAGPPRVLDLSALLLTRGPLLVRDVWRRLPDPARDVFSTSAFVDVVFRRRRPAPGRLAGAAETDAVKNAAGMGNGAFVAVFQVFVHRVLEGDQLCVIGDGEQLGNWDVAKAVPLTDAHTPVWSAPVALPPLTRIGYRFIIRRAGTAIVQDVSERCLELNEPDRNYLSRSNNATVPIVLAPSELSFNFPTNWKGAGVALPVFSLRSNNSCGVGEFNDLPKIVDFCVKSGYQLLQLLPINDTTSNNSYRDSYPYSAVSSFALHPQYLNIEALGTMPLSLRKEYAREKERLNALEEIDYIKVMQVKNRFIRTMYKIHKDEFLVSKDFTSWFSANQDWLVPYAVFHFFMDVNGTSNYDRWGIRSSISKEEMEKLAAPDSFYFEYLGMIYYTQFHLHQQLEAATEYAAERQVIVKGDLPIGVNRYCVDTWVNPHLFRLDMQAGAPPDFFSADGQNWYFPTYNWEEMSKDNYGWWRSRLSQMAKYFHAYRIDHILGFFRIWEIPASFKTGMAGRFYPAHAVSRQELQSLGLWDIERYVKPYVRDGILQDMFQENWWKIKERFFEPIWDRLKFKQEYDTERKIDKILTLPKDAAPSERRYNEDVAKKLFTLLNNVCLLQDVEAENMFHPRFMMQQTSSYAELPNDWKTHLHTLHEDYFHRRQDELWKKNGLERLPMMKSASRMLVCGEDLGFIPDCVPSVMSETGILSLAVQRMPDGDVEFGIPADYKYECVASTSSHDTSTFRGWWEEIDAEQRKRYWTQVMHRDGGTEPPAECTPEIVEWAIRDHLACPAMWTIFPLQDLLGMDGKLRRANAAEEQINDPSNPDHVWNFRLHINVEEIVEKTEFMNKLAKLNKDNRRGTAY